MDLTDLSEVFMWGHEYDFDLVNFQELNWKREYLKRLGIEDLYCYEYVSFQGDKITSLFSFDF